MQVRKLLGKIKILVYSVPGAIIKILCVAGIIRAKYGLNKSHRDERIIASLTSYGRRVDSVVFCTIISLLRQTCKPDEIILWLDKENYDDNSLPARLKSLEKYGLSIRYCQDIKSYKKFVPALEAYPNDIIITFDDDIYYRPRTIEMLFKEYNKDKSKIYCNRAHRILQVMDNERKIARYNSWENRIHDRSGKDVFATTGGGTLFKSSLLYKDVCNSGLFMRLSPKADDVWFYFMALLNGTEIKVLRKWWRFGKDNCIFIDNFYQILHKNSSLMQDNCESDMNDAQIKNIMLFYGISDIDV